MVAPKHHYSHKALQRGSCRRVQEEAKEVHTALMMALLGMVNFRSSHLRSAIVQKGTEPKHLIWLVYLYTYIYFLKQDIVFGKGIQKKSFFNEQWTIKLVYLSLGQFFHELWILLQYCEKLLMAGQNHALYTWNEKQLDNFDYFRE